MKIEFQETLHYFLQTYHFSDKPEIETEPKEDISNQPDNSDQQQNTQNGVVKEVTVKSDKPDSPAEPMDDEDFDFDDVNELEPDEASEETAGTSLKTFVSQNTGWDEPSNGVTSTSRRDSSSKNQGVSIIQQGIENGNLKQK